MSGGHLSYLHVHRPHGGEEAEVRARAKDEVGIAARAVFVEDVRNVGAMS